MESSSRRPLSRQTSPIPRRQLGTLSVNQRSYSRMSSKGASREVSPILSPLPIYSRGRSVKFGETEFFREERPLYNATFSPSKGSPVQSRQNSPPASILKSNTSYPEMDAAAPTQGDKRERCSPPRVRGRSASRQRLAARKREAQLHHSFYDDSFVEEFVLKTKDELEMEEKTKQLQSKIEKEEVLANRAEEKFIEANTRLNALQRAKDILRATSTHKSREVSESPNPPKRKRSAKKKESVPLEEDSDPDVQSALACIAKESKAKKSRKDRPASEPIVTDDDSDEEQQEPRKKAKLEKIVSSILSEQRKSKSKRSVVVINFSDSDEEDSVAIAHRPARTPASLGRGRSRVQSLDSSFLLEESDKPILLRRRAKKKANPTRSISNLRQEEELSEGSSDELLIRRPPTLEKNTRRKSNANNNNKKSASFTSTRADPYATTVRATRAPRAKGPTKVDANDPMAVFFDAAFPSPSKFDEMISRSGGIRDGRRGKGTQPSLVLPSTISRKR